MIVQSAEVNINTLKIILERFLGGTVDIKQLVHPTNKEYEIIHIEHTHKGEAISYCWNRYVLHSSKNSVKFLLARLIANSQETDENSINLMKNL